MAAKKRKRVKRNRRSKSHELWIAPDLERTIKGEGGRRGLSEPPYGYYLQLADLALKSWGSSAAAPKAEDSPFPSDQDNLPLSASAQNPLQTAAALPRPRQFRVAPPAGPPKVNLPKTQVPKLAAPKPPKRRLAPKLTLPKPPKRHT